MNGNINAQATIWKTGRQSIKWIRTYKAYLRLCIFGLKVYFPKARLHQPLVQSYFSRAVLTLTLITSITTVNQVVWTTYGRLLPVLYCWLITLSVTEMAYQSLVERRDWFLEQNKIHSDEDKRPNRKISGLDQMEGSFRKIAID